MALHVVCEQTTCFKGALVVVAENTVPLKINDERVDFVRMVHDELVA